MNIWSSFAARNNRHKTVRPFRLNEHEWQLFQKCLYKIIKLLTLLLHLFSSSSAFQDYPSPWYNRNGWLGVKHQATSYSRIPLRHLAWWYWWSWLSTADSLWNPSAFSARRGSWGPVLCPRFLVLGGSEKLVCTSECPLQSFAQEVARGRSVTSGPISE